MPIIFRRAKNHRCDWVRCVAPTTISKWEMTIAGQNRRFSLDWFACVVEKLVVSSSDF